MAKVLEFAGNDLGQIQLGPIQLTGPIKIRVSGRFIPPFTIDLTKPPTKGEKTGIMRLISPKVQLLIGNSAYEISYEDRSIKSIDPKIFEKDTFIDTVSKLGIIPTIALIGLTVVLIRRVL